MSSNVCSLDFFVANEAPSSDDFTDEEPHEDLNSNNAIKSELLPKIILPLKYQTLTVFCFHAPVWKNLIKDFPSSKAGVSSLTLGGRISTLTYL